MENTGVMKSARTVVAAEWPAVVLVASGCRGSPPRVRRPQMSCVCFDRFDLADRGIGESALAKWSSARPLQLTCYTLDMFYFILEYLEATNKDFNHMMRILNTIMF